MRFEIRKAIMDTLQTLPNGHHVHMTTPELTRHLNEIGVKASITTVRRHVRTLESEDRICGYGAMVAPNWGLNPHFDGEPL